MTELYIDTEDAMSAARQRFGKQRSNPSMDMVARMITGGSDELVLSARPKSVRTRGTGRNQPRALGALLAAMIEEAITYGHVYKVDSAIFTARALAVIYPMLDVGSPAFKGISITSNARRYIAVSEGGTNELWFQHEPGTDLGLFAENIELQVTLQRAMSHLRKEPDKWPRKIAHPTPNAELEIERLGAALRGIG